MKDFRFLEFIVGVIFCIAIFLTVAFWFHKGREAVFRDCQKTGIARIENHILECKLKGS